MRVISRVLVLSTLLYQLLALLVAKDSPCGSKCGNVLDSTSENDIVCKESDYGKSAGIVWQTCLNCEISSKYLIKIGRQTQTDLQAALYNMRHATSECLWGGQLGSNPCVTSTACGPLQAAVEYDGLAANVSAYGYCSLWSSDQVTKCRNCLDHMDNGHYLMNYINVLDGACKTQPLPGSTLSLEGRLFSTDVVNITSPTPTAIYTPSGPAGPLSLGGIVGVAFGGLAFLLSIIGCCIVINGKRRRKAYLLRREQVAKNWPTPQGNGEMFETPLSQKPLRGGWQDESPISAGTEGTDRPFPKYFSPYNSQYNSPVSALEGPSRVQWPIEKTQNIGIALSPDGEQTKNSQAWPERKGKDKAEPEVNEYELQEGVNSGGGHQYPYVPPPAAYNNTPVLSHPGYGRHGPSPPRTASDDDESGYRK